MLVDLLLNALFQNEWFATLKVQLLLSVRADPSFDVVGHVFSTKR